MQRYYLARNAYFCRIDDGGVLLDLSTNKYFSIEPAGARAIELMVLDVPNARSKEVIDRDSIDFIEDLANRRLLTTSEADRRRSQCSVKQATHSIAPGLSARRSSRGGARHAADFAATLAYVAFNMKRARIRQMVDRMRMRNTNAPPFRDWSLLAEFIGIFRFYRALTYTAHDACLFNALVLAEFLGKCSIPATFLIGVRTKPFLAHSWVQVDDCVLDETAEKVQSLTPILAV